MAASPLFHRLINTGSALLASGEAGIQPRTSPRSSSSPRLHAVLLPRPALVAGKSAPRGRIGFHSSIGPQFLSSIDKVNAFQFRDKTILRSSGSSSSNGSTEEPKSSEGSKTPFGYTRKDVLLIGLGVTLLGVGLKSGLEFVGVDPLQAGNVIQLVLVLGLTVVWIGTYIFRVSNKDMTYAQQLRDYEKKVMEKRLDSLSEAELQVLVEQVEEEKRRLASGQGE